MTKHYPAMVEQAYDGLSAVLSHKGIVSKPRLGLVLGSGLSGLAERMGGVEISYDAIPGFPPPSVAGHAGKLYIGTDFVVFAGRYHYYEGHGMDTVLLPMGLMHALGVTTVILTNAAGSLDPSIGPGSLVLLRDHINMMGENPLLGPHLAGYGPRFPDMSAVYSPALRTLARSIDTNLHEGVYLAVSGPSYETPAEIQAYRTMGASLVGMSTVPEATLARAVGMEVLAISLVTNLAAGLGAHLDHQEVMEEGKKAATRMGSLIEGLVHAVLARP